MNAYKEKYITQFYSTTLKIPPSMLGDDRIPRLVICSKAAILCRDLEKMEEYRPNYRKIFSLWNLQM